MVCLLVCWSEAKSHHLFSKDRDAYRCLVSDVGLRAKLEAIIPLTAVSQLTSFADTEKHVNLDEVASSIMAIPEMKELQKLTQSVLDDPYGSNSRPIVPFLVALCSETKDMLIKHHLFRAFRQLLHESPRRFQHNYLPLCVTPKEIFEILQDQIMESLFLMQGEVDRDSRMWDFSTDHNLYETLFWFTFFHRSSGYLESYMKQQENTKSPWYLVPLDLIRPLPWLEFKYGTHKFKKYLFKYWSRSKLSWNHFTSNNLQSLSNLSCDRSIPL